MLHHFMKVITVCWLKPGPPRQWKPIRGQNLNNRFQHFQIQPIKCPVQNNEISTCLLTGDVNATVSNSNQYFFHVLTALGIIICCTQFILRHFRVWTFSRLKKSPSNALWKLFEWNCSQTIWRAFLDRHDNSDSTRTQTI